MACCTAHSDPLRGALTAFAALSAGGAAVSEICFEWWAQASSQLAPTVSTEAHVFHIWRRSFLIPIFHVFVSRPMMAVHEKHHWLPLHALRCAASCRQTCSLAWGLLALSTFVLGQGQGREELVCRLCHVELHGLCEPGAVQFVCN